MIKNYIENAIVFVLMVAGLIAFFLIPEAPARLSVNQLSGFNVAQGGGPYAAGNQTYNSVRDALIDMALFDDSAGPQAGGTLTINGESLGSYDYIIVEGSTTVSSFTNGDWFTATEDSRSAFVTVKGDLTIDAGQTFIPSNRKLFTAVYVQGDLTVNGSLSMSARGANHSAGAGNVTAADIRIAAGSFATLTDPTITAAGGSGATGGAGVGSAGGTATRAPGGGGAGGGTGAPRPGGNGAAGTAFSGGPGGGGSGNNGGGSAASASGDDGGAGGVGDGGSFPSGGGGAGNAGGAAGGSTSNPGDAGSNGTGGILLVFSTGAVTVGVSGVIQADGAAGGAGGDDGGAGSASGGGGSGGGVVFVMHAGTLTNNGTIRADGGAAGGSPDATAGSEDGGAGGAGSAETEAES